VDKIIKPKIFIITTHPMAIEVFMLPHIRALCEYSELFLFTNTKHKQMLARHGLDLAVNPLPLMRRVSPLNDFFALSILIVKLISIRPDVVHTITPKAGLLGMLAAWLVRVPIRIHTFTGQVWANKSGLARAFLRGADQLLCGMATDILVDSPAQRQFLVEQGVLTNGRGVTLSAGSVCGVNTRRFRPNSATRQRVRQDLNTPPEVVVCLYVGRLNADKGVLDLASAFAKLSRRHPTVQLWVVGPDEGSYYPQMLLRMGDTRHQVRRVGWTYTPEIYMQSADLLCLPSYREGFGCVVIEAAACGIPCLASNIFGLTDSVISEKTGWMHRPGDVDDLCTQLENLIGKPESLRSMGSSAKKYVERHFAEETVVAEMLAFYRAHLKIE
jgi:glycosyltransferase involved in cell wall biosynthesis